MVRIFLGNFDFEHDLAGMLTARNDRRLAEINRSLLSCFSPLLGEGGVLAQIDTGGPLRLLDSEGNRLKLSNLADKATLTPWGWSSAAFETAGSLGIREKAPDLDIVRKVNRRSFRLQLERELEIALPHAGLIRSERDLEEALAKFQPTQKWVLKAEFGMSGRERILGRGSEITAAARNWMNGRLNPDRPLTFEPWLDAIREAGICFEIPFDAPPRYVGLAQLLTDAGGTYCGSRFGHPRDSLDWQIAIEAGFKVAAVLRDAGYFGPLGIDAMQYRDRDGSPRIRPLQDLNARLTMGRLAIEWLNRLDPHECGSWIHLKNRSRPRERPDSRSDWPSDARIVRQSSCNATDLAWYCIAASSQESRLAAERIVANL